MTAQNPSSTMRKPLLWGMVAFVLLIPISIGLLLWQSSRNDAQSTLADCDVRQGCTLPGGAVIRFTPPQDVTKPFNLYLTHVSPQVQRITIHFAMRNMDLGFNLFEFKPQGQGVWLAKNAVLPLCVDERNDFLGDLALDGQHYNIVFTAP
ncbi:hypothetical protein [Snodgrassella sp. CFCC 13594]|uniref:hypothetical protein n=1 Tax=Snodgrassella sp. CFCC 13594 TaxID=1775559 RepID=UPI00083708B0|nr:hypothetical protein [Snodgrassella sp. CFCC 13594]